MTETVFLNKYNYGVAPWRYQNFIYEQQQRLTSVCEFQQITNPIHDMFFVQNTDILVMNCMYDQVSLDYAMWLKKANPALKLKLLYDDLCIYDKIPGYIKNKNVFKGWVESTRKLMDVSDEIITTTDVLKQNLIEYGEVKEQDKVKCLPNLLPLSWLPQKIDLNDTVERRKRQRCGKAKPRIAVSCLLNHLNNTNNFVKSGHEYLWNDKSKGYVDVSGLTIPRSLIDLDGAERIMDDFDLVKDVIRQTCDIYEWIIIGSVPNAIQDLVQSNKVKYVSGCPITNYIKMLNSLQIDLAVVPLLDSDFNRSKSPIKVLEFSSIGVPSIVSDIGVYDGLVLDQELKFNGALTKDKLDRFFSRSVSYLENLVNSNANLIKSPFVLDGTEWRSYLLSDNLDLVQQFFVMGT